ncbi:MAG: lipid-A-disaccharide synthase [Candidatus Omnitrophica bacterium]|nr:lipid-A-disaccharide synthase [Candidatus Omnitrophota bacterium]
MAEEIKILIVCGEPSGDLHASNLTRELLKLNPHIRVLAVGGKNLSCVGAEIFKDIKELTVFGFFNVLKKLPVFFKLKKIILKKVQTERIRLIILVDFAGFNLRLARAIKRKTPVIYYISPQVWASRKGRIKTIKKYISKLIVFFKFEEEFYKRYEIDVEFVGHPLLDIVKTTMERKEFMNNLRLSQTKTTITLLPGSRQQEIENILPIMLKTAQYITEEISTQFIIAKSPQLDGQIFQKILKGIDLDIKIVEDKTYDCLNVADFCLVCSGTATLETAIMQKPFVIIYKMNLLNYLLYRPQVKVPFIGMVNIVAGKKIIPEFIQFKAIPKVIAKTVIEILKDNHKLEEIKSQLSYVKSLLEPSSASSRAAKIIYELFLNNKTKIV